MMEEVQVTFTLPANKFEEAQQRLERHGFKTFREYLAYLLALDATIEPALLEGYQVALVNESKQSWRPLTLPFFKSVLKGGE